MAQLNIIGEYQNASEKWAAEYLRDNLPDDYRIYASLCLVYENGVSELDLIVAGGHAVHLVDVKGLSGEVQVGQGGWICCGAYQEDTSHYKIQQHARKVPAAWLQQFGANADRPWFQGSIFITGDQGEHINIIRHGQPLRIFGPDEIVAYLQTSDHPDDRNGITPQCLAQLERFLALTHKVRFREKLALRGFKPSTQGEPDEAGHAVWRSDYHGGSLREEYDLEVLHLDKIPAGEKAGALHAVNARYNLLASLHGVPGIPRVLPPFKNEQRNLYILPVAAREGNALAEATGTAFSDEEKVELFRRIVNSVHGCHRRGVLHSGCAPENILTREDGEIAFREMNPVRTGDTVGRLPDYRQLARLARFLLAGEKLSGDDLPQVDGEWPAFVNENLPGLAGWYEGLRAGEVASLGLLREYQRAEEEVQEAEEFVIAQGAVLNDTYRLVRLLGEGSCGQAWEAENVHGSFRCCVKIFGVDPQHEETARLEFQRLVELQHPGVVRLYSFQKVNGLDQFFIVNELGDATLRGIILDTQVESESRPSRQEIFGWFSCCVKALEYLHSFDPPVMHRDIKPSNITVTGDQAKFIDFSTSMHADLGMGTPAYMMPAGKPGLTHPSPESDLYALCLSFYELLKAAHPAGHDYPSWEMALDTKCPTGFPQRTWTRLLGVLQGDSKATDQDLSAFLRIGRWNYPYRQPLPREFCEKWAINPRSKMEPYIVAVLLQNEGTRTKNQVLDGVLKWKRESSGHRNSYAAALANLRDHGVLDYPKGKQPKGKQIKVNLSSALLLDWQRRYD